MALPASWVLKDWFHRVMTVGLWLWLFGTLVFIPAALNRAYWMFLAGLFIMGAGLAVLQTAAIHTSP